MLGLQNPSQPAQGAQPIGLHHALHVPSLTAMKSLLATVYTPSNPESELSGWLDSVPKAQQPAFKWQERQHSAHRLVTPLRRGQQHDGLALLALAMLWGGTSLQLPAGLDPGCIQVCLQAVCQRGRLRTGTGGSFLGCCSCCRRWLAPSSPGSGRRAAAWAPRAAICCLAPTGVRHHRPCVPRTTMSCHAGASHDMR